MSPLILHLLLLSALQQLPMTPCELLHGAIWPTSLIPPSFRLPSLNVSSTPFAIRPASVKPPRELWVNSCTVKSKIKAQDFTVCCQTPSPSLSLSFPLILFRCPEVFDGLLCLLSTLFCFTVFSCQVVVRTCGDACA